MKELWKSLGLTKDDTVLIQANCVHLMRKYNCKPKDILEGILEVVGTAVFPTFNVDGVSGNSFGHFDIRNTPSRMGVLSEAARIRADAVRSGHPTHSFTAIGNFAHAFNVNPFSGYGKDSPFTILRRLNGKIMVIGLPNSEGNTLFHHVEELHRVPYRFYKRFSGQYTDRYGKTEERTYSFYCNGGVKTLLDPIDDLMWKAGLYKGDRPYKGNGVRIIEANDMYAFVSAIIKSGKAEGLLYERE